jgi:hypothetical protein
MGKSDGLPNTALHGAACFTSNIPYFLLAAELAGSVNCALFYSYSINFA